MVALAKLTDIGGVTETALRGASVLVLEDELLLRKQVAAVLEQHEADVTAVGTVDEARRMIASTTSPLRSEVVPGPVMILSTATVRLRCAPTTLTFAPAAISAGTASAAGEALHRLPAMVHRF